MRNVIWMVGAIFGLLLTLVLFFAAQYAPWIILWLLAAQV